MTPDIRLIALDLDGTLLGADHSTIPQRNLDALRAASRRGVKLAIASGRSWSLIRENARDLPIDFGITANGGCVVETATGKPLVESVLDPAQCAAVIRILRKYHLSYELYFGADNMVERADLPNLGQFALSDSFLEMYARNMTVVEDMLETAQHASASKFDIFYVDPAIRQEVIAALLETGPLAVSGGLATNLELTAPQVNKGVALSALAHQLGLTADQVMAFGDADNDLEMLAWAGWSFAMANGSDAVKQTARYLTGDNESGGVGMAVERYVLQNRA